MVQDYPIYLCVKQEKSSKSSLIKLPKMYNAIDYIITTIFVM